MLSNAAKWILGVALVLGVLFGAGNAIRTANTGDSRTAEQLEESYGALDEEARRYARVTQGCAVSGGLECLHSANRDLAEAVRDFQTDLGSLEFSDVAIDKAEEVDQDSTAVIGTLERMASATDPAEYARHVSQFQSEAGELDQDVQDLLEAVRFSQ